MKKIYFTFAMVMIFLLIPVKAHAGGGYAIPDNVIQGIKGGTITPGTTLSFTMDDLNDIISDFEQGYATKNIQFYWRISNTELGAGTDVEPIYHSSERIFTLTALEQGKFYTLYVDGDYNGTNFNNNTNSYLVKTNLLPQPTGLTASDISSTSVKLSWTSSHGGNHVIYQKIGGSFVEIPTSIDGLYSKTINSLSPNTTYTFAVAAKFDPEGVGVLSNEVTITTSKSSSSDGGSGGGSGGSPGYSIPAPSWNDGSVVIGSFTPGYATVDITTKDHSIGIQVYKGKVLLADKVLGYWGNTSIKTKIPYNRRTTFKWRIYRVSGTTKKYTGWKTVTISSKKLARPTLSVTKISSARAGLRWSKVTGATGYKVYKGNKMIKHLGKSKTTYLYKKKGAGSGKYRVAAEIKVPGVKKPISGPKSKAKKGKANFRKYSGTKNTDGMSYGKARFSPKKISLKGNTYTITAYVANSRIFKLIRFNKLEITLLCNGKKVGHKTFRNYKVNLNQNKSRKITLTIKGKGGVDFRNAEGTTIRWSITPYWQYVGTKAF